MSCFLLLFVGLSVGEEFEITTQNSTTETIWWYKLSTDDPEVLAHNATLRKKIAEQIIPLGKSLYTLISKLPKGGGERFMKELDEYNDLHQHFINLVREDKANSKPEVDYLHDNQYPHLLYVNFCEEDMEKNFDWTNATVKEFYEKREVTNDNYIDLQLYYNWYHPE